MKFFPFAVGVSCVALLASCGPKPPETTDTEKQDVERKLEEHQARQQRELHEREAALDERERMLTEREQQLANAGASPVTTPTPTARQTEQPQPPVPLSPVAVAPAQALPVVSTDASYQTFYDDLSPYGAWIAMPGYGYVWQPTATTQNPGWRPYTLGRWAFTDQGWAWVSDEPFGWITYHYGRWMRTRSLNWVWVPGDQWAPAWVSWRYGNDYIGWAPLPPEARFDAGTGIQQWADQQYNLGAPDYTFVPASDFGDESMADDAVPPDQNGAIYDDSNNMTNIYYDSATYAVICYGPNYEFMRSKCRRPLLPPLRISRNGFHNGGKNGAVIAGNTLQVAAPRILPNRIPVMPRAVRGRVADTRLVTPTGAPAAVGAQGATIVRAPSGGGPAMPAVPAMGMRVPSRMKPVPLSPEVEARKARDLQTMGQQTQPVQGQQQQQAQQQATLLQQQQAATEERVHQEAVRAAAEQQAAQAQQHAEEAVRAQRAAERAAAEEQSAKVAREQAVRQVQQPVSVPASVPAGSQAAGQGRGQQ